MTFIADAVEHAEITENAAELVCKAPREFLMGLRSGEMQQAVAAVLGKPKKIRAEMGEGATQQLQAAAKQDADKAKERALENPEVQRFQELFPDSQIRTVRNLKE
jgi:putative sterol carrier protein